jgi:hypothetical protein
VRGKATEERLGQAPGLPLVGYFFAVAFFAGAAFFAAFGAAFLTAAFLAAGFAAFLTTAFLGAAFFVAIVMTLPYSHYGPKMFRTHHKFSKMFQDVPGEAGSFVSRHLALREWYNEYR